ncbi:MAG: DUF368 domain-containing protein [Chitinivibrionales bacterium]|nr:DUF368 domain-containing protein [Chitinivibrionales bacterium]MBD3356505.1 DUF368 domain-containing protein [Chitinivibrionales bacterium]
MIATLKDLVFGFFIGLANIIPGVSGGTFLLVFGIYERVIRSINQISGSLKELAAGVVGMPAFLGDHDKRNHFVERLHLSDIPFLVRLILGALVAIISLSSLMKFLLNNHFVYTYAFFFGLILVSVLIPLRLMKKRTWHLLIFAALGIGLTVFVSASVNPADKARLKSEHYRARYETASPGTETGRSSEDKSGMLTYTGRYTAVEFAGAAAAGATAVSAMVLPGISGSLVLILLGRYYEIISAVSALRNPSLDIILYLAAFAAGMAVGLPLFARLVGYVLQRYHDQTMAFLTGLMVGSLYALWPFKHAEVMDLYARAGDRITLVRDALVYTNANTLPERPMIAFWAGLSCLAGVVGMSFFVRREIEAEEKEA